MTTKIVKKTVEKKTYKYKLEVSFNGEAFKANTNDFYKTLKGFVEGKTYPIGVKTKVIFTYSKGDNVRYKLYSVPRARKLFRMMSAKDYSIQILADQLTQRLV